MRFEWHIHVKLDSIVQIPNKKSVTKGAAVARERPQGSFVTRRNTIARLNTYVFAREDYLHTDPYIPGT